MKVPLLKPEWVRRFLRSSPAVALLLPNKLAFDPDFVFAVLDDREFRIRDMCEFLEVVGAPHLCAVYQKFADKLLPAPPFVNVSFVC